MTKLICIEIEKPRNCPYRVAGVNDEKLKGWVCVRENKVCPDDDSFPCWCRLIEGRRS